MSDDTMAAVAAAPLPTIAERLAVSQVQFTVGTRVMHDEGRYRGTVRCVEVLDPRSDGRPAVMIGIEWDDANGRHNGTAGGVRYFDCADKHGSFVTPNKIHPASSLEEVLTTRFTEDFAAVVHKVDNLMSKDPAARDPETGAFPNVWNVDCSAHPKLGRVAVAGPELGLMFPAIRQLSINAALLESWAAVAAIASALPLLETYSVRGNKLGPVRDGDLDCLLGAAAQKPQRLTQINATATGINAACVGKLLHALPHVTELNAGQNPGIRKGVGAISLLPAAAEASASLELKSMSLDGAHFDSLDEVADVLDACLCERLESLNLNRVPVKCLKGVSRFPKLEKLMLRDCQLGHWDEILPVHEQAPQLRHLCFSSEVLDGMLDDGTQRRQHVVAVLPKHVTHLNLSYIRESEYNTARQAVMTTYIKRAEQALEAAERAADPIDVAVEDPAVPEVVKRLIREQRTEGVQIFVPKPKRIELELRLQVHVIYCDFATFTKHSKQHFSSLLAEAATSAADRRRDLDNNPVLVTTPRVVGIDFTTPVRQSVASLRAAIAAQFADESKLPVHTIAAGAGMEAAEVARDFSVFAGGKTSAEQCMVLMHVDAELSENPGAVSRGFHLHNLHPDTVNLHGWRISSGDHIVAALVTDGASRGIRSAAQ